MPSFSTNVSSPENRFVPKPERFPSIEAPKDATTVGNVSKVE